MCFLFLLILFLNSCASGHNGFPNYSIPNILPIDSFVKVEIHISLSKCTEDGCFSQKALGHGSGSIISNLVSGSYVLTAGHVCEENNLKEEALKNKFDFVMSLEVVDIDGLRYSAKVVKINSSLDTCIMFIKGLAKPSLRLKNIIPKMGEKVYNVAAPAAIFSTNMVPILEGRYSGILEPYGLAVYTIPAIGGSSGSPVVNNSGELVGMIHSVHRLFPHVSFSPKTDDLYVFVYDVIN